MAEPQIRRTLPLLAVGGSVVLWSTTYVLSAIVLDGSSPAVLSVLRFLIALAVLVPIALRRRGFAAALRRPRTILLGLTGVTMYYSLANIGLVFTSAGTASLAAATLPAFTALAAVVILRERISVRTAVGLVIATVGIGLVAASGLGFDVGLLLCSLGLLSYGIYTALLRRDAGDEPPDAIVLATATAIWGTVLMLPWLGWEVLVGQAVLPATPASIWSLLFLGLVVTAPTMVLFNYGAERLPAAVSGVATAGIPAMGYAFALLFGEEFSVVKALGGLIALVGIVIATIATPSIEPAPAGATVLPHPVDEGTGTDADADADETVSGAS